MHVQSCCFAYKTHCFLTFSLLSASLALKVSIVRLAIFTLETDYPSETGYPLDNSGQTNNTSKFEN